MIQFCTILVWNISLSNNGKPKPLPHLPDTTLFFLHFLCLINFNILAYLLLLSRRQME